MSLQSSGCGLIIAAHRNDKRAWLTGGMFRCEGFAAFALAPRRGEREGPIAKQWEGEGQFSRLDLLNKGSQNARRDTSSTEPLTLPAASRRAPSLSPLSRGEGAFNSACVRPFHSIRGGTLSCGPRRLRSAPR